MKHYIAIEVEEELLDRILSLSLEAKKELDEYLKEVIKSKVELLTNRLVER